jgi:4-hydroxy-tetrahydrodipicolinate reductase
MKIAIIGYGKMGKMLEEKSTQKNIVVTSIIDPNEKNASFKSIDAKSVAEADVCIDFSHPEAVINNINALARLNKNVVVGTTGWYDNLNYVRETVEKSNIGFIYAGNFSIGMNLFYRIIEYSSKLFNKFDDYDAAGYEIHHNKKADCPSGTAKQIVDIMVQNISRKTKPLFESPEDMINSTDLHFSSVRCGHIPGTHKILFDSLPDTIELSHIARNREGFTDGALLAAEWIDGKKGFFTLNDFINNIINEEK